MKPPTDWFPRLHAKTEFRPGLLQTYCWVDTRPNTHGYSTVCTGSKREGNAKRARSHIVAYERFIGPVPAGLELDHKCRDRACWNPQHMEPVTRAENIRRGAGKGGVLRAPRTTCRYGHELTPANTYTVPDGRTQCRTCHADRSREYYQRKVS